MSIEYEPRSVAPAMAPGHWRRRALGRWGSIARVMVGAGLIVLAFAYWRAGWRDV